MTGAGPSPMPLWRQHHVKETFPRWGKIQGATASGNLFAQHSTIRLIQLYGEVRPAHMELSVQKQKGSGFSIG